MYKKNQLFRLSMMKWREKLEETKMEEERFPEFLTLIPKIPLASRPWLFIWNE